MSKLLKLLFLPVMILGLLAAVPADEPLDILIAGGHVVDGTGNPWYAADVGIRNERITAVGKLAGHTAKRTIDAQGLIVWADVTVFDFAKIHDVATFEDPNRYSEGVRYVVVNGQLVLDGGKMTGALPGRVFRGQGYRSR